MTSREPAWVRNRVLDISAAAWALLLFVREKKWLGWWMLGYAVSVAIATVYGRYHYAVDAAAGIAISVAALLVGRKFLK